MALNWNIEKVKDWKLLTTETEASVTEALVWAALSIGIPDITAKNYNEFFARIHMVERLSGTYLKRDGQPYYITRMDVKRRIGLMTNCSRFGRTKFIKRQTDRHFETNTGE